MFCRFCGKEIIHENAVFCEHCGKRVVHRQAQPAQAAPVAPMAPVAPAMAAPAPAPKSGPNKAIIGAVAGVVVVVLAIVLFFLFSGNAKPSKIELTNVPDNEVRRVLAVYDTDGDGTLQPEEMATITELTFDTAQSVTIPSGFENLEHVIITGETVTEVVIEKNECVTEIAIHETPNIHTVEFDDLKNIQVLDLTNCPIDTIDISGMPNLVKIILTGTNVTKLDVSHNPKLQVIEGGANVVLEGIDKIGLKEYFVPKKVVSQEVGTNGQASWIANYDTDNRLSTITYTYRNGVGAGQSVTTYTYDDKDRPTGYVQTSLGKDSDTRAVYHYDDKGRLTTSTVRFVPEGQTMEYGSNAELKYNDKGQAVEYSYGVIQGGGATEYLTYDANGHVASIGGGNPGMTQSEGATYTYDGAGNLVSYAVMGPQGYSGTATYNDKGQCTKLVQDLLMNGKTTTTTSTFTYDNLGRMTSAISSSGSNSTKADKMGYDKFGNLTSLEFSIGSRTHAITIEYQRIICTESIAPLGTLVSTDNPFVFQHYTVSDRSYIVWNPISLIQNATDIVFSKDGARFMTTGTPARMAYVKHTVVEDTAAQPSPTPAPTPAPEPAKQEGVLVSNDFLELTLPASWADKVEVGAFKMDPNSGGYQEIKMKDSGKVVMQIFVDPMGIGGFFNYTDGYNSKDSGHFILIALFSGDCINPSAGFGDLVSPSDANSMLALTTGGAMNYDKAASSSAAECDNAVKTYFNQTILPTLKIK